MTGRMRIVAAAAAMVLLCAGAAVAADNTGNTGNGGTNDPPQAPEPTVTDQQCMTAWDASDASDDCSGSAVRDPFDTTRCQADATCPSRYVSGDTTNCGYEGVPAVIRSLDYSANTSQTCLYESPASN